MASAADIGLTEADYQAAVSEKCRRDFLYYVRTVFPAVGHAKSDTYRVNWHHEVLADRLQAFVTGDLDRLIVSMPPRHGKTELCSRMLPTWVLGRNPDAKIIGASHSTSYAVRKVSKHAKNIIGTDTYQRLFPDTRLPPNNVRNDSRYAYTNTVDEWDIYEHAGGYLAAGTGQAISGSGADYLIIDDPISEQDAYSQKGRDNNWSWWETEAETRIEGESKVLLVMTRWHQDDLAGRLLKKSREGEYAKEWEEIRFPALYEGGDSADRRDPREEIDEPLWPWRRSKEELFAKRESSPSSWDALWQQRPTPDGGAVIKEDWCQRRWQPPLPRGTYYQSWDLRNGGSSSDSSFAVGQLWFRPSNRPGLLWLVDQTRGRWDINETIAEFRRRCDAERHPLWARARTKYVENKADGRTLIPLVRGDVSGVEAVEVSGRDGNSGARLNATAPYWSAGDIWLPEQPWVESTFIPEITSVPSGAHDDQADAASQVINRVLAPDDDDSQSFAMTSPLYGHG